MRTLRASFGGRARIWWVTHRQDAIRAAQLSALVGLFLTASSMDYRDQLDAERAAREAAEAQLSADRAIRGLPNPAIVIDAANAQQYGLRLAEIAGGVDAERARAKAIRK